MATATVSPGVCGFQATVVVAMMGDQCTVTIDSQCAGVRRLAEELGPLDPMDEIQPHSSQVRRLTAIHCPHASCPLATAIIKTIEVEAGLALPQTITIEVARD